MTNTKLVEIAGERRAETKLAFQIYDGDRTEWVPRSMVEDHKDGTFSMPAWLAEEKGFV